MIDEDVLHSRVPFVARTQQCFAVKAGIDGLLDNARRSFCDTSEGSSNTCLNKTLIILQPKSYFKKPVTAFCFLSPGMKC